MHATQLPAAHSRTHLCKLCVCFGIVPAFAHPVLQNKKSDFQGRVPKLSTCSQSLPAIAYGTLTPPLDAVLFHDSSRDGLCGTDAYYIDFT